LTEKLYNIYLKLRLANRVVYQLTEQILAQLGTNPEVIKERLSEIRRLSDSTGPHKL
jgi:hypothetical protein